MALSVRRSPKLPAPVRGALALGSGERVLAWTVEQASDTHVVATNPHLYAVSAAGERVLARPWHEVDAGTWSAELTQLTVSFVDGGRPGQWTLGDGSLLPEAVRERVQASVVLAQLVDLGGRRRARAVIRQDLGGGGLVEQVVLGRGARADDPDLVAATEQALAYLREQVGLG